MHHGRFDSAQPFMSNSKNNQVSMSPAIAATRLLSTTLHDDHPIVVYYEDGLYYWDAGGYKLLSGKQETSWVHRWLISNWGIASVLYTEEVVACLKAYQLLHTDERPPMWLDVNGEYDPDRPQDVPQLFVANGPRVVLSFRNGLLYLDDPILQLRPSTPRFFTMNLLPHRYDGAAQCPRWTEWLHERVQDAECEALMQEYFGYILSGRTDIHSVLVLQGFGGTGKSSVGEIIETLVGSSNRVALPIEEFTKDYALAQTHGKLVCLVDEVETFTPKLESTLKWYTGGRTRSSNRKYRDYVDLKPTARIVMNVNEMPTVNDVSGGMQRRLMVVPFDHVIPTEKQRDSVLQMLKAEAPGIINWAIDGYLRLVTQGHFTRPKASTERMEMFAAEDDFYGEYAKQRLEYCHENFVSYTELRQSYALFANENVYPPKVNMKKFPTAITRIVRGARRTRGTNGVRGLRHVKIKPTS